MLEDSPCLPHIGFVSRQPTGSSQSKQPSAPVTLLYTSTPSENDLYVHWLKAPESIATEEKSPNDSSITWRWPEFETGQNTVVRETRQRQQQQEGQEEQQQQQQQQRQQQRQQQLW